MDYIILAVIVGIAAGYVVGEFFGYEQCRKDLLDLGYLSENIE